MYKLRNRIFYSIRPLLPRRLQLFVRRTYIRLTAPRFSGVWPIDPVSGGAPENWPGWPEGKRFAFVLTHDVEKEKGLSRVKELTKIEMACGFRSSFNFVAKGYETDREILESLRKNGFEIGVHGVYHDGKMFSSYTIFKERAVIVNQCLADWGGVGFRAPSMHHNLKWLSELDIEYDASTFDTDPFEPQPDGARTIFPFWCNGALGGKGFVELPYTLPQDFTPFILLKQQSNDLWKRKLDWIVEKGGMALLNSHPDYMSFTGNHPGFEEYPVELYRDFLKYVQEQYSGEYWHALPWQVAEFVRGWREKLDGDG